MPKLALKKDCTGCLACVDSCSHGALIYDVGPDGHIYPSLQPQLCVNCGLCEKVCPVVSSFEYSNSPACESFASWSNNKEMRQSSASGGVFSAIAEYTIEKGGVVYGATMDGVANVHHLRICKKEEIPLLQGSKYTQSNVAGIYKQVLTDLRNGKLVLFSGTGCQVAGLYSFLKNRRYSGDLLTIDIICGGIPSKLLIDKFVESEPYNIKRIVSFRTKDTGWKSQGFKYNLKVEDEKGVIHDYTDKRNLITSGFACEMTNRYSCYKCQYAGLYRMSDYTIGDYWGVKDFQEEQYNGISVIISHNQTSTSLLEEMSNFLTITPVPIDNILSHNHRIDKVIDNRYKMPERKYLTWTFNHLGYNVLKKIYALDFCKYSPWMIYKVYRVLISKILR